MNGLEAAGSMCARIAVAALLGACIGLERGWHGRGAGVRTHTVAAVAALVGLLLEYQGSYSVVKSDRLGVMQHDPFSWQVENGEFVRLEEISAGARHLNQTLNSWLNTQSDAQRESFVDALFGVLDAFNIKSFADNKWDWQQIPAMLGTLKHLDSDTRQMLQNTFREIALMGVRHQTDQKKD